MDSAHATTGWTLRRSSRLAPRDGARVIVSNDLAVNDQHHFCGHSAACCRAAAAPPERSAARRSRAIAIVRVRPPDHRHHQQKSAVSPMEPRRCRGLCLAPSPPPQSRSLAFQEAPPAGASSAPISASCSPPDSRCCTKSLLRCCSLEAQMRCRSRLRPPPCATRCRLLRGCRRSLQRCVKSQHSLHKSAFHYNLCCALAV